MPSFSCPPCCRPPDDEVLPPVPVRQWVLSLPFEIRYRLAWDGKLVSAILAVYLRVV